MFAENRSKRQNSQKGIGEKPPPKAEFPKGGWFLKRFSLKLFKNHNFSKNSFKKQNSQKFIGEKPPPKAEFPKGGWFLKRFSLNLFQNNSKCVLEGFRSGMWFWKTIPESKAPTTGMCLFEEIQPKSPQKQLYLKGKIPKGMWFWKKPLLKAQSWHGKLFCKSFKSTTSKSNGFWRDLG